MVNVRYVCILSVEPGEIGDKSALLQEIAGTAQIGDPGVRLFRPRFLSREPLTKRTQSKSRARILERLMNGSMDHETIDAIDHHPVGRRLQIGRRVSISISVRGKGLGRDEILPMEVGNRSALEKVRIPDRVHTDLLSTHRDIHIPLDLHTIARKGAQSFV